MRSLKRTITLGAIIVSATTCCVFAIEAVVKESSQTFTISGQVGVPGVMMKGFPGEIVTGVDGKYSAAVPANWSRTVIPVKKGYTFDPPTRTYRGVNVNLGDEDFVARVLTFVISGTTGVSGVVMQGLPDMPISDSDGRYKATVLYGWAGKVVPVKKGCVFAPTTRAYSRVESDQTGQDYAPERLVVTISGQIVIQGTPVRGVTVSADNGGSSALTDAEGRYSVEVPYGWTGTTTLKKEGFEFNPPSKSYTNVATDIDDTGRPRPAAARTSRISAPRTMGYEAVVLPPAGGNVLVVATTEVRKDEFEAMTKDMRVMLRILQKEVQMPQTGEGVFVDYGDFFGRAGRTLEALYIQGYGALFFVESPLPLTLPAQPPQSAAGRSEGRPEEHVDPVWQQAQQEIMPPEGPAAGLRPWWTQQGRGRRTIEELKGDLIKALKHASNIRHLKADEIVVLTVLGGGATGGASTSGGFGVSGGYGGSYETGDYVSGGVSFSTTDGRFASLQPGRESAQEPRTTMTIQAKKSDIDVFAKGELSPEQFGQKVKILTY